VVKVSQYAIDLCTFIKNYLSSPVFVMKAKHFLHDVRERAVPKIVKQRARASNHASLFADLVMRAEQIERARHQMHNTDGMSEPAMLCTLISEHGDAELFDAAQALKLY
jgi:hypothetical protein